MFSTHKCIRFLAMYNAEVKFIAGQTVIELPTNIYSLNFGNFVRKTNRRANDDDATMRDESFPTAQVSSRFILKISMTIEKMCMLLSKSLFAIAASSLIT